MRHLFPGEEASAAAFNLLVRGVARLAEAEDAATAAGVVLATRLKLLVLLGYAPEVSHARGAAAKALLRVLARPWAAWCATRASGRPTRLCFALSMGAVATLRSLCENSLAEIKDLELDDRATAEVEQVVAQTLAFTGMSGRAAHASLRASRASLGYEKGNRRS